MLSISEAPFEAIVSFVQARVVSPPSEPLRVIWVEEGSSVQSVMTSSPTAMTLVLEDVS